MATTTRITLRTTPPCPYCGWQAQHTGDGEVEVMRVLRRLAIAHAKQHFAEHAAARYPERKPS